MIFTSFSSHCFYEFLNPECKINGFVFSGPDTVKYSL